MIDGGKGICHDLRMGAPISSEVAAVASHNFPMFEAGYIVASASRNMCPDTMWRINNWVANGGQDYVPPPPPPAPSPCTTENPPAGCADGSYYLSDFDGVVTSVARQFTGEVAIAHALLDDAGPV